MSIKILIGALLVVLIVLAFLSLGGMGKPSKLQPQPIPIFSPSPSSPTAAVSSQQKESLSTLKTEVGKTTDQEIAKMPLIKSKTSLEDGKTEYKFESTPQLINHTIITQNNIVVFEKGTRIKENLELSIASLYFDTYGQPEAETTGSKLYGNFEKTYIYASLGFALLANPFTNEVDELQVFLPTTVDQYKKGWGQDILEQQSGQEQFQ